MDATRRILIWGTAAILRVGEGRILAAGGFAKTTGQIWPVGVGVKAGCWRDECCSLCAVFRYFCGLGYGYASSVLRQVPLNFFFLELR